MIDTDMANDDWLAILYLLQREDIAVQAITVAGTGEAHCEPGIRNALGLVALAGYYSIPVACGREAPLQGDHAFPDSWRAGVDSLLGLTLPAGQNAGSPADAVELLTTVIQASPEQTTLLTLGPLTNVAEALEQTPALAERIDMIYIMGGAVDVPGNIATTGVGIDNQAAEWNIYVDPRAANVVFESGAPITLVPLDATNYLPVTQESYDHLSERHITPEAAFVFDLYTTNPWIYESGTLYFWDPAAAVILSDESLAAYENRNLCVVEEEGSQSGWTRTAENCPEVRAALSIDPQRFEALFLDTLNR